MRLDLDAYLRFLEQFPAPTSEALKARGGPSSSEPFTLRGSTLTRM